MTGGLVTSLTYDARPAQAAIDRMRQLVGKPGAQHLGKLLERLVATDQLFELQQHTDGGNLALTLVPSAELEAAIAVASGPAN